MKDIIEIIIGFSLVLLVIFGTFCWIKNLDE